jgi:CDP-diacylglycerol--glycerol-3-phosphate 3-phosphatidyltransferase
MNLPNTLTIVRIFFVPLLVAALVQERVGITIGGVHITNEWLALAIFLCAAATDLLDGYLARRWRQVTTIGTLLDPIADKMLVSAALISLVQVRVLPAWMAILIVGREFAVSGLRSIASAEGYTIKGERPGQDQNAGASGGRFHHAAERAPSGALAVGDGDDVGRGVLFDSFGSELFPQILAENRRARQETPPPRVAVIGAQTPAGNHASEGPPAGAEGLGATIWKPPEVS